MASEITDLFYLKNAVAMKLDAGRNPRKNQLTNPPTTARMTGKLDPRAGLPAQFVMRYPTRKPGTAPTATWIRKVEQPVGDRPPGCGLPRCKYP